MPNNFADAVDDVPKGAWLAAMVLGFVFFWPIGLGILLFLAFSGKMRSWRDERWSYCGRPWSTYRSSGNSAFDAYRDETLKRLEEEQKAFREFLAKLRRAKDQAEFDQFMADRKAAPPPSA